MRINDVRKFLTDIDNTLTYEIVPIQDPFGPTSTLPDIDVRMPTQFKSKRIFIHIICICR